MISRNPKVESKEAVRSVPIVPTIIYVGSVPIVHAIVAVQMVRSSAKLPEPELTDLESQYLLVASGIVLLTCAFLAKRAAKSRVSLVYWIILAVLVSAPTCVSAYFSVEMSRFWMAVGSSLLIWFAIVVIEFSNWRNRTVSSAPAGSVQIEP